MKILIDLLATQAETNWTEPRGLVSTLHHELKPGRFLNIGLGEAGLVFFHGEAKVGIPLDALVALALAHEPGLDLVQISIEEAERQALAIAEEQSRLAREAHERLQAVRLEKLRRQDEAAAAAKGS